MRSQYIFITLFMGILYPCTQAQTIQLSSHQTLTYDDSYGLDVHDFTRVNDTWYITGSFKNNGQHPIAVSFDKAGKLQRYLYWESLSGIMKHINPVNDTCLLLHGSSYGCTMMTLANLQLTQRNPSWYENHFSYTDEIFDSYYAGNHQVVNLFYRFTNTITCQVITGDKGLETGYFETAKPVNATGCISPDHKRAYIVDLIYSKLYYFDISDPTSPKLVDYQTIYEYHVSSEDALVFDENENLYIIGNIYKTSEYGAEEETYADTRYITVVPPDFKSIKTTQVSTEGRDFEYMDYLGNNQFVCVRQGYAGIEIQIYNTQLELVTSLWYVFEEAMQTKLVDHGGLAKTKLLDNHTLAVMYPHAAANDENSPIDKWEVFVFDIR